MDRHPGWIFLRNVIIKAAGLFILLNLAYAWIYPRETLGALSGYNLIFPGRVRFPHGDVPEKAFNITTSNLRAMYASHVISAPAPDEFRVAIVGDSSVWGFLLEPDQTFTARLNNSGLVHPDGRSIQFYNLGYPTLSVTKDLLILERAIEYQPDLILWFVTLESLPQHTQLESPILQLNPVQARDLLDRNGMTLPEQEELLKPPTFWDRTIVGHRAELSELIRLQLFGFTWAATGVDHYIPETYNERMEDLSSEVEYKNLQPGGMAAGTLAFEAIEAGMRMAGEIPVAIINEPIFISQGENSEIRYNFFYPRWAYDEYRLLLHERAEQDGWQILDLWDVIPPHEFTDSAIHYSPAGADIVASRLADFLETRFDIMSLVD